MNKVSVIIPVWGRIHNLPRLLACIQSQTYTNIECIFVNDNPGVKLQCVHDNIICINVDGKLELTQKRDLGISVSSGEYIQHLDDDDLFLPTHIEFMVDKIKKSGSSAVINTSCLHVNERLECKTNHKFEFGYSPLTYILQTKDTWWSSKGYRYSGDSDENSKMDDQRYAAKLKIDRFDDRENATLLYIWERGDYNNSIDDIHKIKSSAAYMSMEKCINVSIDPDFDKYDNIINKALNDIAKEVQEGTINIDNHFITLNTNKNND